MAAGGGWRGLQNDLSGENPLEIATRMNRAKSIGLLSAGG